jgi:hypothetical protein
MAPIEVLHGSQGMLLEPLAVYPTGAKHLDRQQSSSSPFTIP